MEKKNKNKKQDFKPPSPPQFPPKPSVFGDHPTKGANGRRKPATLIGIRSTLSAGWWRQGRSAFFLFSVFVLSWVCFFWVDWGHLSLIFFVQLVSGSYGVTQTTRRNYPNAGKHIYEWKCGFDRVIFGMVCLVPPSGRTRCPLPPTVSILDRVV